MGIKRLKLPYKIVATRESDILAYTVSTKHVNEINRSIKLKTDRNANEQKTGGIALQNYVVKRGCLENKSVDAPSEYCPFSSGKCLKKEL